MLGGDVPRDVLRDFQRHIAPVTSSTWDASPDHQIIPIRIQTESASGFATNTNIFSLRAPEESHAPVPLIRSGPSG